MSSQEAADARRQPTAAEADRRRYAQRAGDFFAAGLEAVLGGVDSGEDLPAFGVVAFAFVGQRQLARAAHEEPSAQRRFERADLFADIGLAAVQFARDGREAAALDGAHEYFHGVEFIHEIHSLLECLI